MKILIHGAINGDNYGDCLFAKLFYNYLSVNHKNCEVYFYQSKLFGLSDFLRKELDYNKKYLKKQFKYFDLLIYMSGGYFGERNKGIKTALRRSIRYLTVGKKMMRNKRDIIVSGTGAGPIYYGFLKRRVVDIMNYSNAITLRDDKSKHYLESYGVKNHIDVTADTALLLSEKDVNTFKKELKEKFIEENKINILIHLVDLEEVQEKYNKVIIPILNKYFKLKKFNVIMSYDSGSYRDKAYKYNNIWNNIVCKHKKYYHYNSVDEMNSLINSVDLVLTPKLHVGIVASVLNKSVISLPLHGEKTKRFYKQINESERCISLEELTKENFETIFNKYKNLKINVPIGLKKKAQKNLDIISEYINKKNNKN